MSEGSTNRNNHPNENNGNGNVDGQVEEDDFLLVETFFEDGPLGVTLRRRAEDGIVFIFDIVAGSQAVNLDVMVGDELWGVAQTEIGNTPLDKEAWNGLIQFIKQSPRPLRLIWRRKPQVEPEPIEKVVEQPVQNLPPTPPAVQTAPVVPSQKSAGPSHSFLELQRLVARLVAKENGGSKKGNQPDFTQLLTENRQILRTGELSGGSKTTLWMKTEIKRYLILLTDLLIICTPTPGNMFQVDNIVDLQTCKVRNNGVRIVVEGNPHGTPNSFEVLYPGGAVELVADSPQMRDVWVTNIYLAICDCVSETERVLGWRHQYLLGTMHSAVICRDENRVRELVAMCEAGQMEFSAIEAQDADGYTPLHYACILKMHSMVKLLHEASCDVTATDNLGLSSVHWAALRLDDYAMSLLCSHIFDVDLLDQRDRTPLQLACIEGRDLSGKTDPLALKKCVATLLTHQPNVHIIDRYGVSLLHHLAASWQYEALELLLEAGADVHSAEYQFNMTPIHYAANATPTKLSVGEAAKIINRLGDSTSGSTGSGGNGGGDSPLKELEPLNRPHGASTLRALLRAGARPNGRDRLNRAPLHIIAEPERDQKWGAEELAEAVSLLISFGARMDDTPLLVNLRMRYPDINYAALAEKWASLPVINGDKLDVKYNEYVTDESNRLNSIERQNSNSPRSDSSAGCVLCSFQFTMFKRQHHCRLCNASCCDDCSRKRVVIEGNQARTCDSCYNRVLHLQEKANQRELIASIRPLNNRSAELMGDTNFTNNREKLLGSRSGDARDGAKQQQQQSAAGRSSTGLNATMNTMSEAHERLQERGEKLAKLSDRTEEMSNQANEFARMAKQLNEQQKSRWF